MIEYLQELKWDDLFFAFFLLFVLLRVKSRKAVKAGSQNKYLEIYRCVAKSFYMLFICLAFVGIFKILFGSMDFHNTAILCLQIPLFVLSLWYYDEAILGGRKKEIDSWKFPYFSKKRTLFTHVESPAVITKPRRYTGGGFFRHLNLVTETGIPFDLNTSKMCFTERVFLKILHKLFKFLNKCSLSVQYLYLLCCMVGAGVFTLMGMQLLLFVLLPGSDGFVPYENIILCLSIWFLSWFYFLPSLWLGWIVIKYKNSDVVKEFFSTFSQLSGGNL